MRIVPLALLGALLAAPAAAQDSAVSDWTGFYAGVGLGVSQAQLTNTFVDTSPNNVMVGNAISLDFRLLGMFNDPPLSAAAYPSGHVLAGYALQQGSFLFGVEADAVLSAPVAFVNPEVDCFDYDVCLLAAARKQMRPLGHVRGMIGVVSADNRIMGFVAGGIAVGEATADFFALALTPGNPVVDHDVTTATVFGPSMGIGLEVKATDNLRLRAEAIGDVMDFAYSSHVRAESGTPSDVPGETDYAFIDVSSENTVRFTNMTARISAIWQF